MKNIDELIEETLTAEDQALLERYGNEPGYFRQALGLFGGPLGWMMWLCYLLAIAAFAGSLFALWQLFATDALLPALRAGIGAVLLFQLALMLKSFMGEQLQANRVLRELRRLELRLVRIEGRGTLVDSEADGRRS